MDNKEKIFLSVTHTKKTRDGVKSKKEVFEIMDLYAKEVAIDFLKWCVSNYSVQNEGFGLNQFKDGSATIWIDNEEKTMDELFELYLNSKK